MIRLRGGKPSTRPEDKLQLSQFCNDWISADTVLTGRGVIVSPLLVKLDTPDEIEAFQRTRPPAGAPDTWTEEAGDFWIRFNLDPETGLFSRRSHSMR